MLRSSLRITSAGVEVHNFPQTPRVIPLAQVSHFEPAPRVGNFSGIRPATAVLVLTDSTRLPVRKISASDAGRGVDAVPEPSGPAGPDDRNGRGPKPGPDRLKGKYYDIDRSPLTATIEKKSNDLPPFELKTK